MALEGLRIETDTFETGKKQSLAQVKACQTSQRNAYKAFTHNVAGFGSLRLLSLLVLLLGVFFCCSIALSAAPYVASSPARLWAEPVKSFPSVLPGWLHEEAPEVDMAMSQES